MSSRNFQKPIRVKGVKLVLTKKMIEDTLEDDEVLRDPQSVDSFLRCPVTLLGHLLGHVES